MQPEKFSSYFPFSAIFANSKDRMVPEFSASELEMSGDQVKERQKYACHFLLEKSVCFKKKTICLRNVGETLEDKT